METKSRKKIFNIIMVVLILAMCGCGIMVVGSMKGWWDKTEESSFVSKSTSGIVNIERDGIGYSLKKNIHLKNDDLIETKKGALAKIGLFEDNLLALNESSESVIQSADTEEPKLKLNQGELFGELVSLPGSMEITLGEHTLKTEEAVFYSDVREGSANVAVLSGSVEVTASDDSKENASAGEAMSITTAEDGSSEISVSELNVSSLNDFAIDQSVECSETLCFSTDDLQGVLDAREAEKQAALQEKLNRQATPIPNASEETEEDQNAEEDTQEDEASDEQDDSDVSEDVSGGYSDDSGASEESSGSGTGTCTIEIRCDTILNNLDNLSEGKEAYVPSNGCILATSSVEFSEGETVFDVLNRACYYADIQLEYSWTPAYNSYYIEGINNLYEFDCGNESGWMYKVNGWFPNYGCSSYELSDGDVIVWNYTCNGLGADLGANMS